MTSLPVDNDALPKFAHPPVAEVAMGIEFVPNPGLDVVRMVKAHEMWAGRYPKVQQQPALPPTSQPLGLIAGTGLQIGFGFDSVRLWMLAEDEHLLLQLQNDRLILNWRRLGGDLYPSYGDLLTEYQHCLGELSAYLGGAPAPVVADVTYVNQIQSPSPVADLSAVASIFNTFPGPGRVVSCQAQLVSEIPSAQGHTTFTFEPAGPPSEVRLTISSRVAIQQVGDAEAPGTDQVLSALNLTHAASVLGFANITTERMHQEWGRTQ